MSTGVSDHLCPATGIAGDTHIWDSCGCGAPECQVEFCILCEGTRNAEAGERS